MDDNNIPEFYKYNGQLFIKDFPPESDIRAVRSIALCDGDVILAGYPKSGNKWIKTTLSAILQHQDLDNFEKNGPAMLWFQMEFAGFVGKLEDLVNQSKPAVYSTHLWPESLSPDLFNKDIKVIYLSRNPKDVMVSYHEYAKITRGLETMNLPWDKFYHAFMEGQVLFGDYFNHLQKWKEVEKKLDILFVQYENYIKEPCDVIKTLSKHIGINLSEKESDKILKMLSFDSMKQNPNLSSGSKLGRLKETDSYFRKGKVGDWKNYFTVKQSEDMNKKSELFTKETGIKFSFS